MIWLFLISLFLTVLFPISLILVFFYWALIITEGAYLGQWAVTLLYDLTPDYYDRIKAITWKRDSETLATPMCDWLDQVQRATILDVGAGTGRFAQAMLDCAGFDGQVWGLDISAGMLRRARRRLVGYERTALLRGDAGQLPFAGESFDAVVCLEALEFTRRPEQTLGELMRVLRPGGVLLITNRIGWARWFPGRTYSDEQLIDLLCQYPIIKLEIHSWNTFYDQVWVRKAWSAQILER